jgi:hypothetical protein
MFRWVWLTNYFAGVNEENHENPASPEDVVWIRTARALRPSKERIFRRCSYKEMPLENDTKLSDRFANKLLSAILMPDKQIVWYRRR